MKKHLYIFASLLGGLILLAGCQEDGKLFDKSNGQFRFGVSSKVLTRTEYGDYNEAGNHQDINWTADDQIRIYSPTAARRVGVEKGLDADQRYYWADYKIVPDASDKTKATIENLIDDGNGLGNGLAWERGKEDVEHTFYAIYPKPSVEEGAGTADIAGLSGSFTLSIPALQDYSADGVNMQNAFMTAMGKGKATDTQVSMDFYPAFTAYEIDLGAESSELELVSFKFEASTPVAGDFVAAYDANATTDSKWTYTPSSEEEAVSNSIMFGFPTGIIIAPAVEDESGTTEATRVSFTILTLPNAVTNPTITVNAKVPGSDQTVERSLVLKKASEDLTFAACKKHRIKGLLMPSGGWSVSVELDMDKTQLNWEDGIYTGMKSEEYPESSQFTITNAINKRDGGTDSDDTEVAGTNDKADRQTWYFKKDNSAIDVDFNVVSPVGGTWSVEVEGDADSFDITGSYVKITNSNGTVTRETVTFDAGATISGTVNDGHPTKISLHITPKASAASGDQINLRTYVTNADGSVKYSLDSETQLYDLRGYHYFVIR